MSWLNPFSWGQCATTATTTTLLPKKDAESEKNKIDDDKPIIDVEKKSECLLQSVPINEKVEGKPSNVEIHIANDDIKDVDTQSSYSDSCSSIGSLDCEELEWSKLLGSFSILYCCIILTRSVRDKFLFGFVNFLMSIHKDWLIDPKMVISDLSGNVATRSTEMCLSSSNEEVSLTCKKDRVIISINTNKNKQNNWSLALDCIKETIMEEKKTHAVIIVVDSLVDEVVCYKRNLWILKCSDIWSIMENEALFDLKRVMPDITFMIMGSWIPHKGIQPSIVYTYGTENYQPGQKVWKEFFSNICSFSEFSQLCSKADWYDNLVYYNTEGAQIGICNLPCLPSADSDSESQNYEEGENTYYSSSSSSSSSSLCSSSRSFDSDDSDNCYYFRENEFSSELIPMLKTEEQTQVGDTDHEDDECNLTEEKDSVEDNFDEY